MEVFSSSLKPHRPTYYPVKRPSYLLIPILPSMSRSHLRNMRLYFPDCQTFFPNYLWASPRLALCISSTFPPSSIPFLLSSPSQDSVCSLLSLQKASSLPKNRHMRRVQPFRSALNRHFLPHPSPLLSHCPGVLPTLHERAR